MNCLLRRRKAGIIASVQEPAGPSHASVSHGPRSRQNFFGGVGEVFFGVAGIGLGQGGGDDGLVIEAHPLQFRIGVEGIEAGQAPDWQEAANCWQREWTCSCQTVLQTLRALFCSRWRRAILTVLSWIRVERPRRPC